MPTLSQNISTAINSLQEIIRRLEMSESLQCKNMMTLKSATDNTFWANHEKLCRTRSDIQLLQKAQNTLMVMNIEQQKQ